MPIKLLNRKIDYMTDDLVVIFKKVRTKNVCVFRMRLGNRAGIPINTFKQVSSGTKQIILYIKKLTTFKYNTYY